MKKKRKKKVLKKNWKHLKWITAKYALIGASLFMLGLFSITLVATIIDSMSQTHVKKGLWNLNGSNLSPMVLAWQEAMSEEMSRQGVDQKWLFVLLGIMQVESGGNASAHPDIMQASESQGLSPNSISDPYESIKAGVSAFKSDIELGKRYGIDDPKAIIFAYNTGGGFLSWLNSIGENKWTLDLAETYSREKLFTAVTGRPASEAQQTPYNTPFSQAVGKPYYYLNAGNFHYANAVFYAIGGEKAIFQDTIPTFSATGNPDALPGSAGWMESWDTPPAGVELPFGAASQPGNNPYPWGQCTWYAYGRMQEIGKPLPWFAGSLGNGGSWYIAAQQQGYRVEQGQPAAGTAICFPPGVPGGDPTYGHIAVVEATFSDGSCLISESNYAGQPGRIHYRSVSAENAAQCYFIYA